MTQQPEESGHPFSSIIILILAAIAVAINYFYYAVAGRRGTARGRQRLQY